MIVKKTKRMLIVELNAAEKHFLDSYVAEGKLPVFEKLLQTGKLIKTHVGSSVEQLTPWTIWHSIYTGIKPSNHGIIGFAQTPSVLQRHCIWDVLNAREITTGVFGALTGITPAQNPLNLFYFPGALATSETCYPTSLNVIQKFFTFIKKNTIHHSIWLAIRLFFQIAVDAIKGVPLPILKPILLQMRLELVKGVVYQRERTMRRAQCQMDIFSTLYNYYKPQFSTIHLENIASAQHLYWRAAEPEGFSNELGELDSYFFKTLEVRKSHESMFKEIILKNFKLVDKFLEKLLLLLDEKTVLVIITGLGQKKRDPAYQIHKPEIRFYNFQHLLERVDILNCEVLTQANPNITLNFKDVSSASLGVFKLSTLNVLGEYPLFKVKQRGSQLFLEENLSPEMWILGEKIWVENKSNETIFPLFDYVKLSQLRDQYTADYSSEGWILFYGNMSGFSEDITAIKNLEITEIYSLLLSYFNDKI